jgi:hypothetical protein
MKRVLVLLAAATAALAVVFPATAGAASFRGVVIAKDAARKSLVTASADGTVRTVRLHQGFKRLRVGARVLVRGARLPDGTFSAATVGRIGKARNAHVRATVVTRLGARLALSAGGSVFALRIRGGKAGASVRGGGFKAGDRLDLKTRVRGNGLEARAGDCDKLGHDGRLELEGIYLSTADDGTIELAVVHRGRVFVKVPDGVEVPDFEPGDEIALVVTVEADGSFTLVEAENEDDQGDDEGGVDIGKEQFTVAGILASVGEASVVVNVDGSADRAVRCAVPEAFDLTGFEAGQKVYMTCKYREGHFVLLALKRKDAPPPPPAGDYLQAVGTISSLDVGQVSVAVDGHEQPVSCLVGEGMDLRGFAVGDEVKMYCLENGDGQYVVKTLVSDHASISAEGSWFVLEGTIAELSAEQISLDVEGRDAPVSCGVVPGADLSGFAVGDQVTMKCKLIDGGFKLKLLESDTAHYELT